MLHRLYIGSNNETKTLEVDTILAIVGAVFEGFSMNKITGLWKGTQEDTALIEIETTDTDKVRRLAERLKHTLHQEAVGMVVMPVEMSFI